LHLAPGSSPGGVYRIVVAYVIASVLRKQKHEAISFKIARLF